jgi:DNA (cytosine-5)-methyltransferase 1
MAVAVSLRGREGGGTAELGDEVQNCLRASSGGGDKPHVLAPVAVPIQEVGKRTGVSTSDPRAGIGIGQDGDPMYTLQAEAQHGIGTSMAVRRLTPVECERLQGFPDGYTMIPWRGKPAEECPDGPRYKALGNSMAVPVMRWIGQRIAAELSRSQSPEKDEAA